MYQNVLSHSSVTDFEIIDRHIWPDRVHPGNPIWCALAKAGMGDELILSPAIWTILGGGDVHPLTGRSYWVLWRGNKHLLGEHTVRLSPIR